MPEEERPLVAGSEDLAYVTVRIVDKQGRLCPHAQHNVNFTVKGAGHYRAAANGDPVNLQLFHEPQMKAFNGMLTVIVGEHGETGKITLSASAKGLKKGKVELKVE